MSSDQGSETPSFGDLFDDPHAPLLPVDPAGRGSLRPSPPPAEKPAVPVPAPDEAAPPAQAAATGTAPAPDPGAPFGDASGEATGALQPVPAAGPDEGTHVDPSHHDEPDPDPARDDELAAAADGPADQEPTEHAAPGDHHASSDEPVVGEALGVDRSALPDDEHDDPAPPSTALAGAALAGAALAGASATPAPAAWDGTPEPGTSSAPSPRVDTGRLYRSAGAEGPATLDAIPAIDPAYLAARPAAVDVVPESTPATRAAAEGGGSGLTYSGVAVVVIAVTVLVGFADAIITDKLGVLTCLALAASSIYAALVVRKADIWAAVVMPPLAFLAATLTAGQLTLDASGSLLVREGYMIFRTLAVNAPWILGTTLVCLVIVLVRRRRA